jgi:hypothetical protein
MADSLHGYLAAFDTPADVLHAAARVRDAGFRHWDVHTPFPVHGLDAAMGLPRSRVPRFALLGGIAGFATGMSMIWFMNAKDYPLLVGGKPLFSPLFAFPVSYELTILLASFGALLGMFFLNRLPMHYHPVMKAAQWPRALQDRFFIAIDAADPRFDAAQTAAFLAEIGGQDIAALEP